MRDGAHDDLGQLRHGGLEFLLGAGELLRGEELELEGEACWSATSMGRELVPGSVSILRLRDMVQLGLGWEGAL